MTFDKGLTSEHSIEIEHYSENLLAKRFSAYGAFTAENYPDMRGFASGTFHTMSLSEEGQNVPYAGSYDRITGLTMEHDHSSTVYRLSITLSGNE